MRLTRVHIQGFRSIHDLTVDFDGLTALVGSGGVGKSACLRAIDWCINERAPDAGDLHRGDASEIVVAVTFSDLTPGDRAILGRYGSSTSTTFTRTWRQDENPKLSGTALVFSNFDAVRELTGVPKRKAYQDLFDDRAEALGLPTPRPTTLAEVDQHMEHFEREHPELCELRPEDASHLFGFTGGPKLRECFDYVLVDATADAPDAFGEGRDTPLTHLLSSIGELDETTQAQVDECKAETQQRLEELIGDARRDALAEIATKITSRVREYVPKAEIEFEERLAPIRPPEPQTLVRVHDGSGYATDVERQGHGLQRALVIAVLQALADSAASTEEDGSEAPRRSLMLAIEEPELYQHPLQARALAEALEQLATPAGEEDTRSVQIAYSTHSAYFVAPTLFENLRLFRRAPAGHTVAAAADPSAVGAALESAGMTDDLEGKVRTTLAASLREAVFARAVLVCEGGTDRAVVDAVARRDRSFERDGIAVAHCWGKTVIPIAVAILTQLAIPTFVLFDADRGLADRLAKKDRTDAERERDLANTATKNQRLLTLCNEPPVDWPDRGVRASCANFEDNLESDLAEIWPDLLQATRDVGQALGMPAKSEEAYRQAVNHVGDPPGFFSELVERVRSLA